MMMTTSLPPSFLLAFCNDGRVASECHLKPYAYIIELSNNKRLNQILYIHTSYAKMFGNAFLAFIYLYVHTYI